MSRLSSLSSATRGTSDSKPPPRLAETQRTSSVRSLASLHSNVSSGNDGEDTSTSRLSMRSIGLKRTNSKSLLPSSKNSGDAEANSVQKLTPRSSLRLTDRRDSMGLLPPTSSRVTSTTSGVGARSERMSLRQPSVRLDDSSSILSGLGSASSQMSARSKNLSRSNLDLLDLSTIRSRPRRDSQNSASSGGTIDEISHRDRRGRRSTQQLLADEDDFEQKWDQIWGQSLARVVENRKMLRESTNSLSTVERSLSDLDARISSLSVRLDNMEVQRLHIKEDITRKGFWRSIGLELNTEILHPDGFEKKLRNEEESYSNRLVSHSKPPSDQYSSNHTMNTVPTLPQSSSSDNPEDPLSASKSVAYIQSQRIRLRSDSSLSAPADPENLSRLQKEFIDVNDFNEFHRSILPSSSHPGIAQRAERESYIHSSPLRTSHSEQVDRSAGSDRADDLELDDGLDSLHPRTDLALQYRSTRKSNNVVGINHLGIDVSSSSHTSALEVQPPLSPDLLQSLNEKQGPDGLLSI